MTRDPLQLEPGPGDRWRIGGERPSTVDIMGADEGRDLLAWPFVVPQLNGVQSCSPTASTNTVPCICPQAAIALTRWAALSTVLRTQRMLLSTAPSHQSAGRCSARPKAGMIWSCCRALGASILPAWVKSATRTLPVPTSIARSRSICCAVTEVSGYCRFVWRLSIARCGSGTVCMSSRTIASRRMRVVCSNRLPPNCRVVSIGA